MSGEEAAEAVLENLQIRLGANGRGRQTKGRIDKATCGLTSTKEICITMLERGLGEQA